MLYSRCNLLPAMSLSIINSMFLQNNSFICLSKLVHLLAHVDAENEMKCKVKGMKQSADSACVVIPTMLLQISEEPLLHPVVTLVMYWTYHGLTRYVQWSAPLSFVRFTNFFFCPFLSDDWNLLPCSICCQRQQTRLIACGNWTYKLCHCFSTQQLW